MATRQPVRTEPTGTIYPIIAPPPVSLPRGTSDLLIEPDAVARRPTTAQIHTAPASAPMNTPAADVAPVLIEPDTVTSRRPGGQAVFGLGGDALNSFRVETTQEGRRVDALGNTVVGSAGVESQAFGYVAKGDEAKAAAYEAAQAEKNSVGAQLGELVKPFKNLAAGIINGIVPGSDLGDANDPLRSIGEIVAGVTPLGIVASKIESLKPVAAVVQKVENITQNVTENMGSLSNLISGANAFLSSPLGQVATQFVTPATGSRPPGVPLAPVVPQTYIPSFNTGVGFGPGASVVMPGPNLLTFGGPIGKVNIPKGTNMTGPPPPPATDPNKPAMNPALLIALVVGLLFLLRK